MQIIIRKELKEDYPFVKEVIKAAFSDDSHGDRTEHLMVERLRKSDAYISDLSLVAEISSKIVGHILLTKILVKNKKESFPSLALAPVSVHPDFQNKGVGGKLILAAHKIAKKSGYTSIILLGHENYYPRFGYKRASNFNIKLPFEVPDENCMAIELFENGLKNINGTVEYPQAFFN